MSGIPLGPLRFEVEHRAPPPTGGPTLRVRRAADDRELLRFDCFAQDAHHHVDPPGRNARTPIPSHADALEWTLAELRRDLAGWLRRADPALAPPGDAAAQSAALAGVERALRQPPLDLDGLDPLRLRRSHGEKWTTYPEDVLPLWVADMDFPVAEPIRRALQWALDRPDLGYPIHPAPTDLPDIAAARMAERFGWRVEPRLVEPITDVVQGIYVALEQFTREGDGVVVQTPIYPPFLGALRDMRRRLVENPLLASERGYAVDLDRLRSPVDAGTRMLLLCNPHNPTGRAFRRDELEGIAALAEERDLFVVADEIHADLVFPGAQHLPFASLSPAAAARSLTLTSASKAFNIAGLRCAVAIFGSERIRERFRALPRHLRGGLGTLGIEATRAAWRHGDAWLDAVRAYLLANRDFVADFVARELPGVRGFPPEATYLTWLDCRELALEPSPFRFLLERARVATSDGSVFGAPGRGFVRINFATSRAILAEALGRIAKALRGA